MNEAKANDKHRKKCAAFQTAAAAAAAAVAREDFPEREAWEHHAAVCNECRERLATYRRLLSEVEEATGGGAEFRPDLERGLQKLHRKCAEVPSETVPVVLEPVRKRPAGARRLMFAAAAATAAAAVVLVVLLVRQAHSPRSVAPRTTEARNTPPTSPAAWIVKSNGGSPSTSRPRLLNPGMTYTARREAELRFADGAWARLRTGTTLEASGAREARVLRGEAAFYVKPNEGEKKAGKTRFLVRGPNGTARVTGTVFTYKVKKDREILTVARGVVAFRGSSGKELLVAAGEAAEVIVPSKAPAAAANTTENGLPNDVEKLENRRPGKHLAGGAAGAEAQRCPADPESFSWPAADDAGLRLELKVLSKHVSARREVEVVLRLRLRNDGNEPRKILPFHPLRVNYLLETVRLPAGTTSTTVDEKLRRRAAVFNRPAPRAQRLVSTAGTTRPTPASSKALTLAPGEAYELEWGMSLPGKAPGRLLLRAYYLGFPSGRADANGKTAGTRDWGVVLHGKNVVVSTDKTAVGR